MRARDHDLDETASLRPQSARLSEHAPTTARAAVAGRWDVVGSDGMLDLQRSVGNSGISAALAEEEHREEQPGHSPVHDVLGSGGGRPLDPEVRTDMETRLGHDFGDVRVHDDSRAHESATAVNAHAYTVGSNIVFQRDRYDPASEAGKLTLAHELTHVVQQRQGPVDGTPAEGGVSISSPDDRFEREASATAEQAMAAPAGPVTTGTADTAVQREADDEPTSAVQRLVAAPVVQRQQDVVQRQQDEQDEEEAEQPAADAEPASQAPAGEEPAPETGSPAPAAPEQQSAPPPPGGPGGGAPGQAEDEEEDVQRIAADAPTVQRAEVDEEEAEDTAP